MTYWERRRYSIQWVDESKVKAVLWALDGSMLSEKPEF